VVCSPWSDVVVTTSLFVVCVAPNPFVVEESVAEVAPEFVSVTVPRAPVNDVKIDEI
jgi:hypothetical protein